MSTAVRPTAYAGWASGPSGYVAEPIAADKAQGFLPTGAARSSYVNWLQNANYQWQKYLDQKIATPRFGDGSDGDAILVGPTSLARDMHFGSLTATGPSAVLQTNGYRVFVRNTLTTVGGAKIAADGLAANGTTGGSGIANGTVAGTVGIASPLGPTGYTGVNVVNAYGGAGGAGGSGASGSLTTAPGATLGSYHSLSPLGQLCAGGTLTLIYGGAPGSGGGGGQGGQGGAGGGVLAVAARELNIATGADLRAAGGVGGLAGAANSGGGGGGGGGFLWLEYLTDIVGVTFQPAINCPGGIGGAKLSPTSGAGPTGFSGFPGSVFAFCHASST